MAFIRSGDAGSYVYKPIAGQTNCTITREANYRESNAKNLQGYKDYAQGLKGWTASVDMDIPDNVADENTDEINYEELEDKEEAGEKATFVFAFVDNSGSEPVIDETRRMRIGEGLIQAPGNYNTGENATTSISIQGTGKLDILDSNLPT